jgi:hypothetical protein
MDRPRCEYEKLLVETFLRPPTILDQRWCFFGRLRRKCFGKIAFFRKSNWKPKKSLGDFP